MLILTFTNTLLKSRSIVFNNCINVFNCCCFKVTIQTNYIHVTQINCINIIKLYMSKKYNFIINDCNKMKRFVFFLSNI